MATAAGGFQTTEVDSFELGSVQSVARHLIPPGGCYEIRNGLLTSDGEISLRGGSQYYQTATAGDTGGVRFVWAGLLGAGFRVVFATDQHLFTYNGSTPVQLSTVTPGHPSRGSTIGGWLYIDGNPVNAMYAGSLKTAAYSTGTVSVTQNSQNVTGSGTSWLANVDAGMAFKVTGGSRNYYTIGVPGSDTTLTLNERWQEATASGLSYTLSPVATAIPNSGTYAVVAGKLLHGFQGSNRVSESNPSNDQGVAQPQTTPLFNYVELPDGNLLLGIVGLRGDALIFTSGGVFLLQNVGLDIVDANGNPQQSLQQISGLKLWRKEGLATWNNTVIVPCIDEVYVMDGFSQPQPISRSISNKYRSYVQAGYKPGTASVYANHYVLPILDGSDVPKEVLVCRLDKPAQTRFGTFFPWTFMGGAGGNITSLAIHNIGAANPLLLAGLKDTTCRLLKLNNWFQSGVLSTDHDGSNPPLDITLGDIPLGRRPGLVRFARVFYDAQGAGSLPTLQAWTQEDRYVTSQTGPPATPDWTQLGGIAPPTGTVNEAQPYAWTPNNSVRNFRMRLYSPDPATSLIIRGIELDVIPELR